MTVKKIRKPLAVLAVLASLVGLLVLLILTGYRLTWTGFSTKTLWDWLQLLFVPIILASGGYWLNQLQKNREERATEQRNKTEREIAADNQREALLQAYIDKMSELLLEKNLRNSNEDEEVGEIARVRTLTVVRRLDAERKGSVLQFLQEAGLINSDEAIVRLYGVSFNGAHLCETDLRETDLRGVSLQGADLRRTTLQGANLTYADLRGANLSRTNLSGANLRGAMLREADLTHASVLREQLGEAKSLKGATMPDGKISPYNY